MFFWLGALHYFLAEILAGNETERRKVIEADGNAAAVLMGIPLMNVMSAMMLLREDAPLSFLAHKGLLRAAIMALFFLWYVVSSRARKRFSQLVEQVGEIQTSVWRKPARFLLAGSVTVTVLVFVATVASLSH